MVGRDKGAARHRNVLDALDLDPEPVAVIEIEDRFHHLEHPLRAPPVVDLTLRVGRGDQPGELAECG